jgi:hypothetical protein
MHVRDHALTFLSLAFTGRDRYIQKLGNILIFGNVHLTAPRIVSGYRVQAGIATNFRRYFSNA